MKITISKSESWLYLDTFVFNYQIYKKFHHAYKVNSLLINLIFNDSAEKFSFFNFQLGSLRFHQSQNTVQKTLPFCLFC